MIRWSYSQWWVCVASVLALVSGLTVEAQVTWGVWPARWALTGFWLTCGAWSGVAVLVHETRIDRAESRLYKMGGL